MKGLSELIEIARSLPEKKIALAGANEVDSLLAVERARVEGLADTILVGNTDKIRHTADKTGIDISNFELVREKNEETVSQTAIRIIKEGRADALMKGFVPTADIMRAILDRESGLLEAKLLSHFALFEIPRYPKLLGITDAGINISPGLEEKIAIAENAISIFHKLGIDNPKIACVCPVEKVNPEKMICTEHAAILARMSEIGQITGAVIDGPFGLDNAVDPEAAELKGLSGDVAGNADLILCPDISSANVLYKSLAYLSGYDCGGIVAGTSAPVILTSRADSDDTKFASIALAIATS